MAWHTIDRDVLRIDGDSVHLKIVSTLSVGYEHIDLKECKACNIIACNLLKISTDCVSEFAVTLVLAVSRRIEEGIAAV
uniref:D-isomer specific 2-hydroxyacid dehydrogenase catalytic domain-containing protein n=1 Tax=Octopus bimaculoides TaxID=37653 RepID=A0A0L8G5Z3_OCTBM